MAAAALGLEGAKLLVHGPGNSLQRVNAADALNGKTIGIYFSAHWCGPCRAFTPLLKEVHDKVQKRDEDFVVLFVTADRSEEEFQGYFDSMGSTWLALEHKDDQLRHQLSLKFGVRGIPRLVIVASNGQVIADDARAAVMRDREGVRYPWTGAEAPKGLEAVLANPQLMMLVIAVVLFVYQWLSNDWLHKQL